MELVFSINYRVLSTINFSSTKDHGRFVGDEAFNKAKLCVRSYVIGLFIRIRRSHWLIKITGTCNPFNCRGGFSLHVSTETRNEFQILQDQRLNLNSSEFYAYITAKLVL